MYEAREYVVDGGPDFIAIVAITPQEPIVRQYRPALEAFAWELPPDWWKEAKSRSTAAAANSLRKPDWRHSPFTGQQGRPRAAFRFTGKLSSRISASAA
jgi:hypothetical protein